jgi:hypothetical protein
MSARSQLCIRRMRNERPGSSDRNRGRAIALPIVGRAARSRDGGDLVAINQKSVKGLVDCRVAVSQEVGQDKRIDIDVNRLGRHQRGVHIGGIGGGGD